MPVRIDSLDKERRIATNQASLRAHFQIEELSINQGFDATAFEISRSLATRVFDEDAKAYVKQPRP